MSHMPEPTTVPTAHQWERAPLPPDVAAAHVSGTRLYYSRSTKCKVLVAREPVVGWHLSISHPFRYPSWEEIKAARYTLVPHDVTMVMCFPPPGEFVNVHPNCFHLYECRCEGPHA